MFLHVSTNMAVILDIVYCVGFKNAAIGRVNLFPSWSMNASLEGSQPLDQGCIRNNPGL